MSRGMSFVISAPSGAGKSTLCRMLLSEFPEISFSISCTTRSKRPTEKDGVDYYFLSREEFERKRSEGDFAEWAEVYGNLYGTPIKMAWQLLHEGKDLLFDIDVQGAAHIKAVIPDSIFIFIAPPSISELERRLRVRKQDDENSIRKRLLNAKNEIRSAFWYNAIIVNDDLKTAYAELRTIYKATKLSPLYKRFLLDKLLSEDNMEK